MKRIIAIIMSVVMLVGLCACGGNDAQSGGATIEGDLVSVINQMYADVELDSEIKESFSYHMIEAITEETEEYVLGTTAIDYVEAAYAMPMMSAVAYQLVLVRVDESADVEAVKAELEGAFDEGKWVCVMPEKVITANVGNVIMLLAGTEDVVNALTVAFEAQGK